MPLYAVKICSWPCLKDAADEEGASEYVESRFLLLESIKVDSTDTEETTGASAEAADVQNEPDPMTYEVASDNATAPPRLCFRRAGTCAYTHKRDNRKILERAVRRDIMLI